MNLDSYRDAGVLVALELVNELTLEHAHGKTAPLAELLPMLKRILAFDPPSLRQLRPRDAGGFAELAQELRRILDHLARRQVDAAAARLNELLANHPAHPHLAKEEGVWRMHHHPANVMLVPMYASICSEALARMVGAGHASRFHSCDATDCDRFFIDTSKNGTRRFCSTACQNRTKTAAFRERLALQSPRPGVTRNRR